MNMKFLASMITVFISAILIISFAPMFIQATYETEDGTNDNIGWARLKYATGTTTDIDVSIDDNVLSLGGTEPQTGPLSDMIIYSDNNLSVYIKNDTAYYIGDTGNGVLTGSLSDTFHIIKGANNTRITDNGETYTFLSSTWAYYPYKSGDYGSFLDGDDSHLNNANVNRAYIGGLLGIYTYNNINSVGYDLSLVVDRNGDVVSGADWIDNNSE